MRHHTVCVIKVVLHDTRKKTNEALESNNTPAKWSIDELKRIKAQYVAKLKELKK